MELLKRHDVKKTFVSKIAYQSNPVLNNNAQKKKYNDDLIISWIKANRYTDYTVIQYLLNTSKHSAYKIVKRLIDSGLIERFNNESHGKTLLCLTRFGAKYARLNIHDNEQPLMSSKRLSKLSNVRHSLGVQTSIINAVMGFNSANVVDFGLRLEAKSGLIACDAVITVRASTEQGMKLATLALEYERSKKNKARTHYQMYQHFLNVENKQYLAVRYYFADEEICMYYYNKYKEPWNNYFKAPNGKMKKLESVVKDHEKLAKSFGFIKP